MSTLTLSELEHAIRSSWSADTSDHPEQWDPDNPARGQCGPTAFAVRAFFGGTVVVARVADTHPQEHHAWNRLDSGIELDLSRDQFTAPPELTECHIPEEMLEALFGKQARILLARVQRRACL